MIKYSTRGGVEWQIQHEMKPNAVFATRSHICIGYVLCDSTNAYDIIIILHNGARVILIQYVLQFTQ